MELNKQEKILIERLIDKSIDAFIFAIEIINKPTLKHRSENFVFNICNAWELALKASIVASFGENSIYYKNNKDRTITLQKCIEIVFTDYNNPIKSNLNIIFKLRNKATHFITPEYDDLYVSFFQANVVYYVDYMRNKFKKDLSKKLPSNFLTIAANPKQLKDIRLLSKLDENSFNDFLKMKKYLITNSNIEGTAITFEVSMKNVKKDADFTFKIDPNADMPAQIIKQVMDPSNSHPYRATDIIKIINKENNSDILNQYNFRAIKTYEKLENSIDYHYLHKQSNSKTYSEKTINLIRKNIKEIPNYIEICTKEFKTQKKK